MALPVPLVLLLDELGATQDVWQLAAWELHVIMQLVTVELCASRSALVFAASAEAALNPTIHNAKRTLPRVRTCSPTSAIAAAAYPKARRQQKPRYVVGSVSHSGRGTAGSRAENRSRPARKPPMCACQAIC